MQRSPLLIMVTALATAALACASVGDPIPTVRATFTPAVPQASATSTMTMADPTESSVAVQTRPPAVEPTPSSAPEAGSSLDRFWEDHIASNIYTDPVTYTLEVNVPVLRASDPGDAPTAAFNGIVSARVDEMTTAFVDDLILYPPDPAFAGVLESFFSVNATRFALTPRVVSLRLDVAGYVAGAAHPYSFSQTVNFDFAASRELALADLFAPGVDYLGPISAYCIAELETTDFFLGFESGAAPDDLNYRSWNLTDDGVLISFDPYQVGPYAAGPQEIVVPYNELAALIDPAGPAGAFLN
ncbi:MAG TPA: RsiV family protein [Anaerolineales bacterium]|nr:RsiV family protein [Anaerolineales bacterium]